MFGPLSQEILHYFLYPSITQPYKLGLCKRNDVILTLDHKLRDIIELEVNTMRSLSRGRATYHMLSDPLGIRWTKRELLDPGPWSLGLKETELVLKLI